MIYPGLNSIPGLFSGLKDPDDKYQRKILYYSDLMDFVYQIPGKPLQWLLLSLTSFLVHPDSFLSVFSALT